MRGPYRKPLGRRYSISYSEKADWPANRHADVVEKLGPTCKLALAQIPDCTQTIFLSALPLLSFHPSSVICPRCTSTNNFRRSYAPTLDTTKSLITPRPKRDSVHLPIHCLKKGSREVGNILEIEKPLFRLLNQTLMLYLRPHHDSYMQ